MGRLAHGRVVHAEIAAYRSDDGLARVNADPDLDGHAARPAEVLRELSDRLLHFKSGIARPHRMVLVGDGRAEERHDAVAHDLVHRALEAVDRLHHSLEHGIEDLPRLLGIAIGEEYCHLLALALERSPGEENAFGEMLRGVGLWSGKAWRGGRVSCQWCR